MEQGTEGGADFQGQEGQQSRRKRSLSEDTECTGNKASLETGKLPVGLE